MLLFFWKVLCLFGFHRWFVIDHEWDWVELSCQACRKLRREYIPFVEQPPIGAHFKCKSR